MKVRAGIAGAGLMGVWHAQNIRRGLGKVTAVFDIKPEMARRLAARYNGARDYSRLDEFLSGDRFDVLHICTPGTTHFSLATPALEQGRHLIIEKPMTPAAPETEQLLNLARDRQLLVCPVHQFLFQKGTRKALAALPSIGPVLHFSATFCSAGAEGKTEDEADAVIADILPHPLSLLQHFMPGSLPRTEWTVLRPRAGELRASTTIGELSCEVLVSMNARPTVAAVALLGAKGTIHLDLFHGFCVVEPGTVSRIRKITHPFDLAARTLTAASSNLLQRLGRREPAYPGLRELIAAFYSAQGGAAPPPILPEDALSVARARDRILASKNAPFH